MNRIFRHIAFLVLTVWPGLALAGFDVNSLPNEIAPMSWTMSTLDIQAYAKQAKFESNNYTAEYFGELTRVDAVIFTKLNIPLFADAQVTVERLNGKIIGIRVNTTDADPKCWGSDDYPKNCRRDDLKGLTKTFGDIARSLEKQYGPGIRTKTDTNGEQSIQWKSEKGQLMLFLHDEEFDGWTIGLWIARR